MSLRRAVLAAVLSVCFCAAPSVSGEEVAKRDLYGDPLPPGALMRLGTVRMRHGGIIRAAAFSPDGKFIVTADGQLKAWDTATGNLRWQTQVGGYASLAVSPDCNTIVAAGYDTPIVLLNSHTGEVRQRLASTQPGRRSSTSAVAYSSDGAALWSLQRDGVLRRYELTPDGAKLAFQRTLGCQGLKVSPAGNSLAVWSADSLRMVNTKTADDIWSSSDRFECRSCDFSSDGRWLAASCADSSIRVWDATSGREVHKRESPHGKSYPWVHFMPKSATLVSNGFDGTIRFWDVETGKETRTLAARWGDVIPSPDGSRLCLVASSAGGISLLDAVTGEERPRLVGHQYAIRSLAFSPNGSLLATSASNDRTMRLWNLASGRQLHEFAGYYDDLQFTSDGVWLTASQSDHFQLFEVATGKSQSLVDEVFRSQAKLSPNGKLLLGSLSWMTSGPPNISYRRELRAWEMPERRERWQLKDAQVGLLSFDASGRYMAGVRIEPAAPFRRTAVVWSTERFEEVLAVPGVEGQAGSPLAAFVHLEHVLLSPDGTRLVLLERSSPARIVEVPSGKLLHTLEAVQDAVYYKSRFSPDGKHLIVGRASLESWNIETGQRETAFEPATLTWDISPNGKQLVTAARDGLLRLYDFASGRELAKSSLGQAGAAALAFSPDGRTLATGLGDGSILIWPTEPTRWPPPVAESQPVETLDALWGQLAAEAETAYPAIRKLAAQGAPAAAMLRARLESEPFDVEQVKTWIAALDKTSDAERAKAVASLTALGSAAAPALRRALEQSPAEQARSTLTELIAALDSPVIKSPRDLRRYRAIQVLERIGTTEALAVLEQLRRDSPSPREVSGAEAALRRMAAAKEKKP